MLNEGDIKIGETTYHVAVNWNSISGFLVETQTDTMSAVANIAAVRPSELPILVASCIREGERLQGRECDVKPIDLGAEMGPEEMTAFIEIFANAMNPGVKKKE